jgi:hypothetical protein
VFLDISSVGETSSLAKMRMLMLLCKEGTGCCALQLCRCRS